LRRQTARARVAWGASTRSLAAETSGASVAARTSWRQWKAECAVVEYAQHVPRIARPLAGDLPQPYVAALQDQTMGQFSLAEWARAGPSSECTHGTRRRSGHFGQWYGGAAHSPTSKLCASWQSTGFGISRSTTLYRRPSALMPRRATVTRRCLLSREAGQVALLSIHVRADVHPSYRFGAPRNPILPEGPSTIEVGGLFPFRQRPLPPQWSWCRCSGSPRRGPTPMPTALRVLKLTVDQQPRDAAT
jgi:hypothetical protein